MLKGTEDLELIFELMLLPGTGMFSRRTEKGSKETTESYERQKVILTVECRIKQCRLPGILGN